jgi:hypothetical protein
LPLQLLPLQLKGPAAKARAFARSLWLREARAFAPFALATFALAKAREARGGLWLREARARRLAFASLVAK